MPSLHLPKRLCIATLLAISPRATMGTSEKTALNPMPFAEDPIAKKHKMTITGFKASRVQAPASAKHGYDLHLTFKINNPTQYKGKFGLNINVIKGTNATATPAFVLPSFQLTGEQPKCDTKP